MAERAGYAKRHWGRNPLPLLPIPLVATDGFVSDADRAEQDARAIVVHGLYGLGEDGEGVGRVVAGSGLGDTMIVVDEGAGEEGVQITGHITAPLGEGAGDGLPGSGDPDVNGQTSAYSSAESVASSTASRKTVTRVRMVSSPMPTDRA